MKEVKSSSLKVGDLFKWTITYTNDIDEWIGLVIKKINDEYPLWVVYMVWSTRESSLSVGKVNHYDFTAPRLNAKFYLLDKESQKC